MKIYNRGQEIYETCGDDPTVLFPYLLELFPDHEQIRQLNSELLIVVGPKQDTILLDIIY